MARVTKTIKIQIEDASTYQDLLETTNRQYQRVVAFYLAIIKLNQELLNLPNRKLLTKLEQLTHRTKNNPNPPYDLSQIAHKLPSGVRRSAINSAIGLAKAWQTSYEKWQKRKSKYLKRQDKRAEKGKTRFPFTEKPPQFPMKSESNIVWYSTVYKALDARHIKLKVFNGKAWEYVTVKLSKTMPIPSGYKKLSPELIRKGDKWYLHQPIQKKIKLTKITEQLKNNPKMKICAVDLGLNHTAVLTVQDASGKVYATKFIRGHEIHSRRLSLLRRIFSKQSVTKIIQEGVKFAKNLWRKIRRINKDYAHKVSYWIVEFALKHGCSVIVFEHLKNLQPSSGSKSRRMNQRLMFWLKGDIFKDVQYKAVHQGILVSRINPRNTSKICPNCSHVENYGKIETTQRYQQSKLFKCNICGYQANADFVGSRNSGRRFFARYVKSDVIEEHQNQAKLKEVLQLEFAF